MRLIHGDCLDALRTLPSCSVDAVVTDPPAGIAFMGKTWDGDKGGRDLWIAWLAERLAECLRVLKPGGHAVVWALPRTSGWTHRALEDAGFDVRDCVHHLFGSGFPKSLDVGKAIDKAAGCEREVVGMRPQFPDGTRGATYAGQGAVGSTTAFTSRSETVDGMVPVTAPATELAARFAGFGTALKPAVEHWWLARKPLDSTVAGNVTRWGTGALNIDATRVTPTGEKIHKPGPNGSHVSGSYHPRPWQDNASMVDARRERAAATIAQAETMGRWPADVVLSHNPTCDGVCSPGCAVAELDQQSGTLKSGGALTDHDLPATNQVYGKFGTLAQGPQNQYSGDSGGASRFFATFKYQAKPSTREKGQGLDGRNHHPTCKPSELMRWLIRLVTPPGGTVLDPFAGSGTTGVAATLEGFDVILIEAEAEYLPLIEGRVRWAESQVEQPALFRSTNQTEA